MITTWLFILVGLASVVGLVWFFVHVAKHDSPYATKVSESEQIEPGAMGDYDAKPVPLDDLLGGSGSVDPASAEPTGKDRDQ